MNNGQNAKRQRQKELRRQKLEQERKAALAKKRRSTMIFVALVGLVVAAFLFRPGRDDPDPQAAATPTPTPTAPAESPAPADPTKPLATVTTSLGELQIELAPDTSPNLVEAFTRMAQEGFYDGLTFHRIVKDFAIQGGDPDGDGTGGPPTKTVDEPPAGFRYVRGTVAMAKSPVEPAGTAGSQFFIVPGDGAASLPAEYAVLGRVVEGFDTVERLNNVETEVNNGEQSRPVERVTIEKVEIKEP